MALVIPKGDIRLGASENASTINQDNKVTKILLVGPKGLLLGFTTV